MILNDVDDDYDDTREKDFQKSNHNNDDDTKNLYITR